MMKRTIERYIDDQAASGRLCFTKSEAVDATGSSPKSFLHSAAKLQKRGRLFSPRSGFYVIVPSQYQSWGAPPPDWYIRDLMGFEGIPYYVGLLKAAEIHGARHQAVMEFQVITNKQLPRIKAGRSHIGFYYRKNIQAVEEGLIEQKSDSGYYKVSGPELTALDLVRYPKATGGINHIATVLVDLGEKIDPALLGFLSTAFERSQVQRLGYLLDYLGHDKAARYLLKTLENTGKLTQIELVPPPRDMDPDLIPEITEKDRRWRMTIRRPVEVDE